MSKLKKYNLNIKTNKLAVVGLGYVGLPLAIEFGKKRIVVGYDTSKKRINELKNEKDSSLEISSNQFKKSKYLNFTNKISDIKDCKIFIVAIPTPVNKKKIPDLSFLKKCCEVIGNIVKKDDLIIFESTVYPGLTEEFCVPIIQKKSGLKFNVDFYCGYSPERINPGDREHTISQIIKVTSGSTPEISILVDKLYKEIIVAGTFRAPTIKVAEAAKIIENTQRDVNIALMNELSMIFNKLNIDTNAVLEAAKTKWNFLNFKPGFVGGHCIGVDPYYLAHKSIQVGHNPEIITAGRKINDSIPKYVAKQLKKIMIKKGINYANSKILILGFTFKENISDHRNTKVLDLINEITKFNKKKIDIFDPLADKKDIKKSYGIDLIKKLASNKYQAIIISVAHNEFKNFSIKYVKSLGKKNHVILDLLGLMNANDTDFRL